MTDVNVQLYDPNPDGMDITSNLRLAKSFYNSRNKHPHVCNYEHFRDNEFDRNAGAVFLYKKNSDGVYEPYDIPGKSNQEYHIVAYGNKYYKHVLKSEKINTKKCSYAHAERILMRDILDDLISYDVAGKSSGPLPPEKGRPSDNHRPTVDEKTRSYDILKNLTEDPEPYKKYLTDKGIIIKMWSERPPCSNEPKDGGVGGTCVNFIKNIFPEGSQFGFIVRDYVQGEDNKDGGKKVEKAFKDFEKTYNKIVSAIV